MTRKNKTRTRTATRLCATCGTPFTWTSRNPRRRFCNPVCKARWWRATNTDTTKPGPADTTTAASTTRTPSSTANAHSPSATTNAVTHEYDPYVAGYRTEQTPSAVQNCPNCNQPIAVINLLITSAAAYVNTPSRAVTDVG
ncbi:hypothetical protein [Micromonospora fulviviridis]|uniref:Uncharacterized protein n=1 Tax=Micromonospora fulviviridis TaxID=47860 RepID=A0ABV2VV62_9ACTN